jgi:hypothetical protein
LLLLTVTLSVLDAKKPTVPLKSSAPHNNQHPRAAQLTSHVCIELKKDPGVPRLPNLKVRSAEMQRRRSVCALRPSCLYLPIINTPSARGASPSQSPPHLPPHEDATTASEPTLSLFAQLATSATANDLVHQKGSSPNHPRCMLRVYRLRFPEAAGKLLRAPRQQAKRRS